MTNSDSELAEALQAMRSEFKADELAYLAMTSKPEAPFRDRLAYLLHRKYWRAGFVVAREWNKVDLAILRPDGLPFSLVELKAMYTFDAFKTQLNSYLRATLADERKAQKHASKGTTVYSLLLVTHLSGRVSQSLLKAVKYSGRINNAIAKHVDASAVLSNASANIHEGHKDRKVVVFGSVEGGSAFDLKVDVRYWLVRNDGQSMAPPIGRLA